MSKTWQAEVWNNGDETYKESFKGDMITIPPKSFILMDLHEAVAFNGQYVAPKKNERGDLFNRKPLTVKWLAPKEPGEVIAAPKCNICGGNFPDDAQIEEHVKKFHPTAIKFKKEDK